jgi:hypothetical protein
MTPCQQLSDRMPVVALGRSRWSAAEEAHLTSCVDCQAEWNLVLAAGRLGALAPPGVDPEVTSAEVRRRLAEERAGGRRIRRWALVGVGVAAALAVAFWTGRPAPRRSVAARPPAPAASPGPARPSDSVAKPPASAPSPSPGARADSPRLDLPVPGIDDLSDSDLGALLQAMDEPLAGASTRPDDGAALGDPDDRALAGALTVEEG